MDWDEGFSPADEDGGNEGGWITTFSDLMSLLLTFFILLFSMSSVETTKFKQLLQSVQSALGVENVPEAGTREGLEMMDSDDENKENAVDELGGLVQDELEDIQSEVQEFVLKNKLTGNVSVALDARGAVITISDVVLFYPGEAAFSRKAKDLLKKMVELLEQFPYQVQVEGHTDNIPINTRQYPSNWELSSARACEIVRYYIDNGINPNRLQAVGFAEYRPISENSTAEGRSRNRRVEIVYIREAVRKKIKNLLKIDES